MSLPRGTIAGRPTFTIIDLLEKHKGTGAFQFNTLEDAIRYISRMTGENELSANDLLALAQYMARDGAAWVKGINFHSNKLSTMIKEMELTARSHHGRRSVPFGVLVISTSKSELSRTTQMQNLKVAGLKTLEYLNVDKNRAFLAIHDDTEHLHLHIVYNRYNSSGHLTEREPGKFRRYLMEEICARVAFDVGYNLEPGAKTVPLESGELIDRVSGRIIRTIDFEPVLEGCKARNRERRKARTGHDLEDVVLEAYRSSDNLARFRTKLSLIGIQYVQTRTGAIFIDPDGKSHSASSVNYCLSRGRIFKGVYKDSLPDESNAIVAAVEIYRKYCAISVASGDDAPIYCAEDGLSEKQAAEANRRLVRGYGDTRCGRPSKLDMGDAWPTGFPWGGLRLPREGLDDLRSSGIKIKNRGYHAELWRAKRLIAVHRRDQIVVYTRDKEDLRILLRAAHQKWGRVEITGSTAFKKQMADLAVEMNIPVTNRELQHRMQKQRRKVANTNIAKGEARGAQQPSALEQAGAETGRPQSTLDVCRPREEHSVEVKPALGDASKASTKPNEVRQQSKLDLDGRQPSPATTAKAPQTSVNTPLVVVGVAAEGRHEVASARAKATIEQNPDKAEPGSAKQWRAVTSNEEIAELLRKLQDSDQFVEQVSPEHHRLVYSANYRRTIEPLLADPRLQTGLADLYRFQRTELDQLERIFRGDDVSIRLVQDLTVRQQHTFQPAGLQSDSVELFRRYQYHPKCSEMLRTEYARRESLRLADTNRDPGSEPLPMAALRKGANLTTNPGRINDVVIRDAVRSELQSVIASQVEPREAEARHNVISAEAISPDQRAQSESSDRLASQHRKQSNLELQPQVSVADSIEAKTAITIASEDDGITAQQGARSSPNRRTPPQPSTSPCEAHPEGQPLGVAIDPAVARPPFQEEKHSSPGAAIATKLARQLQGDLRRRDDTHYMRLLNSLEARLGSEWPSFQQTCERYATEPDGLEKDRIAFVINSKLQVPVAGRGTYPQLGQLFIASDRNLDHLKHQQHQAEERRRQGGW